MEMERVPAALQERLGLEATSGLLQLLDSTHREWKADMMTACTDRFERRLVEEIASVRIQIAQVEASIRRDMAEMGASIRQDMMEMGASIRQDMAEMGADIRKDMAAMEAGIRQDMGELGAVLRREMSAMGVDLRREMTAIGTNLHQEMASGRVELLKWCFLFWIGQVFAMAGIMGMMLRMFRP
jgi:hypothetical protein